MLCDDLFVVTIRPVEGFQQGYAGFSSAHRDWARWSLTDTVMIAPYDPFSAGKQAYLGSLDLEAGFASKKITEEAYDQDDLAKVFIKVRHAHIIYYHYLISVLTAPLTMRDRIIKIRYSLQDSVLLWTFGTSNCCS